MALPIGTRGRSYTYAQLEALWINAGGKKELAPLMAAIAEAESGGDPSAENSIGACGLWQIHPYQNGCLSAQSNAKMAVSKYNTQGLNAWTTYTSGAYKPFMHNGTAPDFSGVGKGPQAPTTPTQTGGPGSPCILGFGGFLGFGSFCAFSKTEARALIAGLLLGGGVLITGVGLAVLVAGAFTETKAGQQAKRGLEKTAALVPQERAATALRAAARAPGAARGRRAGRSETVMQSARRDEVRQAAGTSREPVTSRGSSAPRGSIEPPGARARRYARSSGSPGRRPGEPY